MFFSLGQASWQEPADSARLNPSPNRANERGDEGESLAFPHRARGACQRSLVLMRAVLRGGRSKESSDPSQLAARDNDILAVNGNFRGKVMDGKLFATAMTKFAMGVVLIGFLLFLPAGTLGWWRGWLFMGILFVPMFVAGLVMMAKAPDLLRKRLDANENEDEQKAVLALSALMFVAAFVVAGLGFRLGWLAFPAWVSWAGAVAFLAAYALYAEVMRENAYLSRTVEVQEGQHVVDTGLYGIVRHPMYSATLLLFLSMPIVLGSPFSFVIMLAYLPIIAKRIRNEEEVLSEGLEGYPEYMTRVKWRLIPRIW